MVAYFISLLPEELQHIFEEDFDQYLNEETRLDESQMHGYEETNDK